MNYTVGASSVSIADMLNMSPQQRAVYEHLSSGRALTQLKARAVYNVQRLASRVSELRAMGFKIVRTIKFDEAGNRYASYVMA